MLASTRKAKLKNSPSPEIQLYSPPAISAGGELCGAFHLDLTNSELPQSISIKLEGAVITCSLGDTGSACQKKRLYVDRQILWSKMQATVAPSNANDNRSENGNGTCGPPRKGKNKWAFTFAMPPGYLPPSFRLNNRIYIQFSIRASAKFSCGTTRTVLQLEHNPVQAIPDEKWGLVCCQNWLSVGSISLPSGFHGHHGSLDLGREKKVGLLKTVHTKFGQANLQVMPPPKLSLKDRLRGKHIHPVRLEALYPENGILAGEVLDNLNVHLVQDLIPLSGLYLSRISVSLEVLTKVSVNRQKFVEKSSVLLQSRKINSNLPEQLSCDLSKIFDGIAIPDVPATFTTKTLSRAYQLILRCELRTASEDVSVAKVTLPVTIFTKSLEEVLPAYGIDNELPPYVIEV